MKSASAIVVVSWPDATNELLDGQKGKRKTMNRMTEDRGRGQREKWAMMTAGVMTKWHSNTDSRSTMKARPGMPTGRIIHLAQMA